MMVPEDLPATRQSFEVLASEPREQKEREEEEEGHEGEREGGDEEEEEGWDGDRVEPEEEEVGGVAAAKEKEDGEPPQRTAVNSSPAHLKGLRIDTTTTSTTPFLLSSGNPITAMGPIHAQDLVPQRYSMCREHPPSPLWKEEEEEEEGEGGRRRRKRALSDWEIRLEQVPLMETDYYCSALSHRATWKLDHKSLVHEELDGYYAEATEYLQRVNKEVEVDDVPPVHAAAATASLLYLGKYSNVNVEAILRRMELARTPSAV